ncbi:methyltransferase [Sphingomonas parva]|uniref:Methyltransferase n=1 Tax=Sphingomonas parva TaxID=2555898 RepID=A0A4Y8ZW27_9SPHN|nr:methyltransferase [Sphingomonas parva]TFI59345.1 methyltransferase [Sphingomonas parva]
MNAELPIHSQRDHERAAAPSPARILEMGMAFWASKTLLSAVELRLFSVLGEGPLSADEIEDEIGLHPRATRDFLDALVALKMLDRTGDDAGALYYNTPEAAQFLDKASPAYVGGILEMANDRLYPFWADLTPALLTGKPQNEIKHSGRAMFETLYAEPKRLEQFMDAMTGVSRANFEAFANRFDFMPYRSMADIGGATGLLSATVARAHPHLACTSYDLPVVTPIAERRLSEAGLAERVAAKPIDFLADDFPPADLITMGMILHDWNLEQKKALIAKAYRALPRGGAFVAIENIIDDARRENAFGLLMSLNMLIEFGDAFDFTGSDFASWCLEAGFRHCEVLPLAGPASAAIAYK